MKSMQLKIKKSGYFVKEMKHIRNIHTLHLVLEKRAVPTKTVLNKTLSESYPINPINVKHFFPTQIKVTVGALLWHPLPSHHRLDTESSV